MRHLYYAFLLAALPVHAQTGPDTIVRVQLLGRAALSSVQIEAVEAPMSVISNGRIEGVIPVGESVTLTGRNGTVAVEGRSLRVAGPTVLLDGASFRLRADDVDRTYRGDLDARIEDGRLRVVNHVRMLPYVASVVASELGFNVPEASKAQAVLARTYAARRLGSDTYFDVDDHTGSQVYRGEGTVTDVSRTSAQATAGQVLTYGGELADAYYYSSSGGHTASNEMVWNGAPVPYLRAVADPYDQGAPDHRWETSADRAAVLRALSDRFGGSVSGLEVVSRTPSGRIHRVRLIGGERQEISGNQFRSAVNAQLGWRTVRSTKVEISVRGDRYVFSGAGFGHGVGMSQYGAIGQARAGRTYHDILSFYFTGTTVSGAPAAPILVADAERPTREITPAQTPAASETRRYPAPRRIVRAQAPAPERAEPPARRTAW